jgi:hypothetical protein
MGLRTGIHGDGKDSVERLVARLNASVRDVAEASDFERMFIFASKLSGKVRYLKLLGTVSSGWRSSRTFTVMEMVP